MKDINSGFVRFSCKISPGPEIDTHCWYPLSTHSLFLSLWGLTFPWRTSTSLYWLRWEGLTLLQLHGEHMTQTEPECFKDERVFNKAIEIQPLCFF